MVFFSASCASERSLFASLMLMIRHPSLVVVMMTQVADDLPWPCEFCDVRFRASSSLVLHLQGHVLQAAPKCDRCSERFFSMLGRDLHRCRLSANGRTSPPGTQAVTPGSALGEERGVVKPSPAPKTPLPPLVYPWKVEAMKVLAEGKLKQKGSSGGKLVSSGDNHKNSVLEGKTLNPLTKSAAGKLEEVQVTRMMVGHVPSKGKPPPTSPSNGWWKRKRTSEGAREQEAKRPRHAATPKEPLHSTRGRSSPELCEEKSLVMPLRTQSRESDGRQLKTPPSQIPQQKPSRMKRQETELSLNPLLVAMCVLASPRGSSAPNARFDPGTSASSRDLVTCDGGERPHQTFDAVELTPVLDSL
ncbi:unnamed protein product [Cyprideis torosa]|uniref:Uncharacterized protein n=1 Tax=Cyprideis torosa TaxID=163714 RepID=A0A7R8WAG8_9CRUS|nr:unnamed protein product [Cyprideis torosa]CAG0891015.1 unnamed protein product [Cyprideis torosa]